MQTLQVQVLVGAGWHGRALPHLAGHTQGPMWKLAPAPPGWHVHYRDYQVSWSLLYIPAAAVATAEHTLVCVRKSLVAWCTALIAPAWQHTCSPACSMLP